MSDLLGHPLKKAAESLRRRWVRFPSLFVTGQVEANKRLTGDGVVGL
jgi:hypothetical protein